MMLIRTYLAPSPVHGIGLFAAEPVAAGTEVWRFVPGFDQALTAEEVRALPAMAIRFLAMHCYKSRATGLYILCGDHARHMNHSTSANCDERLPQDGSESYTVAVRDIATDEELSQDYSGFEDIDDPDNILLPISATLETKDPRL